MALLGGFPESSHGGGFGALLEAVSEPAAPVVTHRRRVA